MRGQMALARAIAKNDKPRATRIARDAFQKIVLAIFQGRDPEQSAAWPLHSDPVLSIAYLQSKHLLEHRTRKCKELDIATQKAAQRKACHEPAAHNWRAAVPDAQTLLQKLEAGETLKLNLHSLSYDSDFNGLVGTNCYGIDYFAGEMTLANVLSWRTVMLAGETWGRHHEPPWAEHEAQSQYDEDPHVARLKSAICRIDREFAALATMQEVDFAGDFNGLVDRTTGHPVPMLALAPPLKQPIAH